MKKSKTQLRDGQENVSRIEIALLRSLESIILLFQILKEGEGVIGEVVFQLPVVAKFH